MAGKRESTTPVGKKSVCAPGADSDGYLFTFPDLVSREFIAILAALIVLCVWSMGIDAPLRAMANPNWTENPAKAPWYFVGLQELLVYFDPWIAGVCVPGIIILGLMAIPYIDTNPRGVGEYNFSDRKFAVPVFMTGYTLWFVLIIIGQFLRGPNWHFYWPWEDWSIAKPAEQQLVNLPPWLGWSLLGCYVAAGFCRLPWILRRSGQREPGFMIRYVTTVVLCLLMFGVIFKIILRLFFHVKYIIVTPYFSI